ncbi:protein transport protein Sec39 [Aspergillus sp. HF37]|nr:protein transport protein Sec39 [Aspergillus sp. HF37]
MAPLAELSGAHAILLAAHFCASGNVSPIPQLQSRFPRHLPLERLFRIVLTFLPESTEPQSYTSTLQVLADGTQHGTADVDVDVSSVQRFPQAVARKRVRKLRLLPLKHPDDDGDDSTDPLTQFLIHRAHRIDSETSLQPLILELLLPFYYRSSTVRTFLISSLLPLLRLNYEYYPSRDETLSLGVLESMDDHTAINVLLSMTGPHKDPMDLSRNLRGLLGPWMYGDKRPKRRKLNETRRQSIPMLEDELHSPAADRTGWRYVNEWLLSRSLVDRESVVGAFADWNGPADADLGGYTEEETRIHGDESTELRTRYGQAGLAVVYASPDSSKPILGGSIQIISRVAELLDLEDHSFVTTDSTTLPSVTFDTEPISSTSRASLLQNALLLPSNPLTSPSASSISFLTAILLSLQTINELGRVISCRTATNICLHSNDDMQLADLQSVVTSIAKFAKPGRDWGRIRQQVLWLRCWQGDSASGERRPYHGLFWRVSTETAETEILKALLGAREYQLTADIYITGTFAPLEPAQVESAAKEAIFTAYDNASNGNRTRGGMKRAYDILQAFQPHFPNSVSFEQIHSLILATHALSFYSLTLQHGVPFQPVSIRVHPDPLSLLEKVLDQNAKAYTKLDDLLSIGQNLVAAGLPTGLDDDVLHGDIPSASEGDAAIKAERRIMSLAISSALSSNDFGTAYSYILTRLTPPSLLPASSPLTHPTAKDDITWRAVYNAGRYRSTSPLPANLQSQIAHLSQRMELLSLSLVLVPYPDPLPEILGAWRRCDEEMTLLRARESEEEEAWDTKADNTALSGVPGGFGPSDTEADALETKQQLAKRARAQRSAGMSHLEEAPMGLFDVARGAAAALQKNAFPLHAARAASAGGGGGVSGADPSSFVGGDGHVSVDSEEEEGRVRKRDVVSNMVTGGLASGIGWVLGAQPVNR